MIDFSPVDRREMTILQFAERFSVADLKRVTNGSIDAMLEVVEGLTDAEVTFLPVDPVANDPYATEGEKNVGWSVAHLIVHTTASSEEWATYSSILARGILYPAEPRVRFETNWRLVTTRAQCIQRLEESRRIRLAYLDAWPNQPHLDVLRGLTERFVERHGPMNAPACFLHALKHEVGHLEQIREAARQARAAIPAVV